MATYYCDFSLTGTGGVGTEVSPYKWEDFHTIMSSVTYSNGDIFMCKGTADLSSDVNFFSNYISDETVTIDNWNPSVNGPWRIKTTGNTVIGTSSMSTRRGYIIIKNGIFDLLGTLYLYSETIFANVLLMVTGTFSISSNVQNSDVKFLGCSIVHRAPVPINRYINMINSSGLTTLSAVQQDCVCDTMYSGNTAWRRKFDNCVTTKSNSSEFQAAGTSNAILSNVQYGWTKPHAWPDGAEATQADLQYSTEGVGITVSGTDAWN